MNGYTILENVPDDIIGQIIVNSNNPVLENEDDLASAIEQEPEQFEELIHEYAPEIWEEYWG